MISERCGAILFPMRNAILLFLLAASAAAQSIGTFTPTGTMTVARTGHTATLLNDGRVLITGGAADASAELYDPSTGAFTPTGSTTTPRGGHTATLLRDGRVLLAAGWNATAEIYDPTSGTFTPTGSLLEDQGGQTATLLPDGKVLVAGGERVAPPWPTAARAELYDPATGTFSFASDYAEAGTQYASGGPVWPTANLLGDGRVLIAGENPPEIYDPASRSFSVTGRMPNYSYGMFWHAATTLRDGTVLVTGGISNDTSCDGLANAELYDPSSGTFAILSPMSQSREIHTSTLLQDGTVLITGGGDGWCHSSTDDTAELYVPSTRSFVAAGRMAISRTEHTATLLKDGTVLIAGGAQFWPYSTTNRAEIYRPANTGSGRRRSIRLATSSPAVRFP
jgi:WD40 repeat protein